MTLETQANRLEEAPRWIAACLGGYLTVYLFTLHLLTSAGQPFSIEIPSDTLSVTVMAAVSWWLCRAVMRSFPAGAPLRPAWILITLAAAAQAVSGLLGQLLGADGILNPLLWPGEAHIRTVRLATRIADGPIRLALLAGGLLAALRILRKFGFWRRPRTIDWAVCGVLSLFTLSKFVEAGAASWNGMPLARQDWTSLAGLPILCILFLEAMLLWRSVIRMGSGPISRCWAAFAGAILLSGLAEAAIWLIPHFFRAPVPIVESLSRFVTTGIFALAPAYQLAAQRRAIKPAATLPEKLPDAVPAVAR